MMKTPEVFHCSFFIGTTSFLSFLSTFSICKSASSRTEADRVLAHTEVHQNKPPSVVLRLGNGEGAAGPGV